MDGEPRTSTTISGRSDAHRLSTVDLPVSDRLARFDQFQLASDHPMGVTSDRPEEFAASVRALDLLDVNLVEVAVGESRVLRTPRMIGRSDPEVYSLLLPTRGCAVVQQSGQETVLETGTMAAYSSSRPFEVRIGPDSRLLRLQVPLTRVPLPARTLERLVAVPVAADEGPGALLAGYLGRLAAESAHYSPADAQRLGNVTADLLAAALAHQVELAVPEPSYRRALLPRITEFVDRHLHDPDLSPASIAAAHHISVSYLHRLFRAQDTTVSTWIRHRRLDRARRDLADPALAALPIHRVAARCGFGDHATFTRAFRATYGQSPREFRASAVVGFAG